MRDFDRSFSLRYVSCGKAQHVGGLAKRGAKRTILPIVFSMDDPLQFFRSEIISPEGIFNNETHVRLGGIDLARYGIIVNECYNSVLTFPAVKIPLVRSFLSSNGLDVVTAKRLVYQEKKAILSCTMRAENREQLYTNYTALFNALRQPGLLTLATYTGEEYCFYSTMRNFKKLRPLSIRALISFDIELTCVDAGQVIFLLASEDGRLFTTEKENKFIDMEYGRNY